MPAVLAFEEEEQGTVVDELPALEPIEEPVPGDPNFRTPSPGVGDEVILLPEGPAPLLMDVTPLSLGLETVGGYCEHVIERNAQIPVEQTRIFTTSVDGQRSVRARVCQGESRRIDENQPLGTIELTALPPAPRGELKIHVTFMMDSDGTLGVRARDAQTGQEQQIRVSLLGGVDEAELDSMQRRHEELVAGAAR
jgi:molecular chaperone DnaK